MQRQTRLPIQFLVQDSKWPIAVERFRSPGSHWTIQRFEDWHVLFRAISAVPESFSVIEISLGELAEWLRRISFLSRIGSNHRLAVVGSRELAPYSALLAEAGAIFCGVSIMSCPRLAGCIERFATKCPPHLPPLREQILQSLPWQNGAADRTDA